MVKGGFAYDSAYKFDTSGEAQAKALECCRETKSDERRKLCKIFNIFHDQCIAVAMDRTDGSPGVGWAIADDLLGAEREALGKMRGDRRAWAARGLQGPQFGLRRRGQVCRGVSAR